MSFRIRRHAHIWDHQLYTPNSLNLGSLRSHNLPIYLPIYLIYIMCPFVPLCLDILKLTTTKMNCENVNWNISTYRCLNILLVQLNLFTLCTLWGTCTPHILDHRLLSFFTKNSASFGLAYDFILHVYFLVCKYSLMYNDADNWCNNFSFLPNELVVQM